MATQVLIAHTGQRLTVNVSHLSSLDDFKAAVARQSSIPANCVIALTPQGKPLKLQTIQTEKDVCVYDMRMAQAVSSGAPSAPSTDSPVPNRYKPSTPPNDLSDRRSLDSWQGLYEARRSWASKLTDDCRAMAEATQARYGEMDVMIRCLDAAVANLEGVVRAVEAKYSETKKWLGPTQTEYTALVTGWEAYLSLARAVPISATMLRFMTGREVTPGKGRLPRQATLEDLVDLETARKTGKLAPAALRKLNTRVVELDRTAPRLFQNCEELMRDFENTMARSSLSHGTEADQLLQDIEAVSKKIDTDYRTTLEYSDSTRDVLQASKTAANHTERLLPTLQHRAVEMDDMMRYAIKARNTLAADSADFMRSITELTSTSTFVRQQVNALSDEEDSAHFDYLRLIQQIPYVYASFAAEAVKRREWLEKVKADSSTLANEMALFQDEEAKRRKRWQKSLANLEYGPKAPEADSQVPGLELNLLGEEGQWPNMTKAELEDFLGVLQQQQADTDLVGDIEKLVGELNTPTKQQSKRLKAFKNGSLHEAALGRSGLLIRGDDEVLRALQDDKTKLENKVKTAESRVRRLEDLLHRQSQASRPSLGHLFQAPSQQGSERNDSSVSVKSPRPVEDRRASSEGADIRLVQRVQQLERELGAERERSAAFEKDLNARGMQHDKMKGQLDEANSTKKDLLENLEALKRESMEERKSLEDEMKRLQTRLEDTEDEIEHFGESRENEKTTYDEKVRSLEMELQLSTKGHRDDALKAQGQVEFLRKESKLQRERNETLTRQLQAAQEESQSVLRRLQDIDDVAETQLKALRDLHDQFSPGDAPPEDLTDLVDALSGTAAEALSRLGSVEGDVSVLKADLDRANLTIGELRNEAAQVKEKLSAEEIRSLHTDEKLADGKARIAALEAELAEGRDQLSQLRVRIADGETGSESLRKRLEGDEQKITSLTEELASKQSHLGSVEEEVRLFQEKYHDAQTELSRLKARVEVRTLCTKDLTQRLYTQNDRLCRLLERLGFTVTREGTSMVIQKVPRTERSTQLLSDQNDGSAAVRRSGQLSARGTGDSAQLELLFWMDAADAESESEKFAAYLAALGSFDTDAFSDTVYRRVKDIEHVARKLQRDLRSYREKAHALQKEAHEKIAYKHFKDGDLALFLPTRNQSAGAWAAFNIGFPHYFLREQEGHRLRNREWLLARISRVQEKVVDLSKSLHEHGEPEVGSVKGDENDNPFDLSDGLRWYLVEAHEDKPGAPSTPGLGKSTVAATNVEAMADMTHGRSTSGRGLGLGGRPTGIDGVSKTLSKSLESRRSSTSSRKALPFAVGGTSRNNAQAGETNSMRAPAPETPVGTSPTLQQSHIQTPQSPRAEPESSSSTPAREPTSGQPPTSQQQQQQQQQQTTPEVRIDHAMDSLLGP